MDNVQKYMQSGGIVTKCQPCETLYRPQKPQTRVWKAPPTGHDETICAACSNKGRCEDPCAPLVWVDGNKPLKERYLENPIEQTELTADYKIVLTDLSSHYEPPDRIIDIIGIRDYRQRAICAMLSVQIPRQEIAKLLSITRQHLNRIIAAMFHKKGNIISISPEVMKKPCSL
jgi:hypothetical protein